MNKARKTVAAVLLAVVAVLGGCSQTGGAPRNEDGGGTAGGVDTRGGGVGVGGKEGVDNRVFLLEDGTGQRGLAAIIEQVDVRAGAGNDTIAGGAGDDAILAATDEGSFQRGLDYAARGMVQQVATLNRGRVVVAKVAGSERGTYQTIVSLRSDPRDAVVEWGARCSCPVARDCKHAVAVLLSVRDVLGGSAGGGEPRPG